MMWPLAAAASSLRALSASVPFYAYPPPLLVRRLFGGPGHLLSAVTWVCFEFMPNGDGILIPPAQILLSHKRTTPGPKLHSDFFTLNWS